MSYYESTEDEEEKLEWNEDTLLAYIKQKLGRTGSQNMLPSCIGMEVHHLLPPNVKLKVLVQQYIYDLFCDDSDNICLVPSCDCGYPRHWIIGSKYYCLYFGYFQFKCGKWWNSAFT